MSLEWIDKYVEGLIEYCYSRDVYEIYDTLDISIIKVNKDNCILQGNDALYIRNYLGLEIVFLRDDISYKFEKFILSHELGHALLHTDLIQAAYNKDLINKGKLEKQADYFAIKLLDIKLDSIYYKGFTKEQISKDLYINEKSLEYICNEVIK